MPPDHYAAEAAVGNDLDMLLGGLCGRLNAMPPHELLHLLYEEAAPIIERAGDHAPYVAARVKQMALDAGLLPPREG